MSAATTARRPRRALDPNQPAQWSYAAIRQLIADIEQREGLDGIRAFVALRDRYPQLWVRLGVHLERQSRRAA